jgi:predicted amidohydrolase
MSSKNLCVDRYKNKWRVHSEGETTVSSTHTSQSAAITFAKLVARLRNADVIVHSYDGKIKKIIRGVVVSEGVEQELIFSN